MKSLSRRIIKIFFEKIRVSEVWNKQHRSVILNSNWIYVHRSDHINNLLFHNKTIKTWIISLYMAASTSRIWVVCAAAGMHFKFDPTVDKKFRARISFMGFIMAFPNFFAFKQVRDIGIQIKSLLFLYDCYSFYVHIFMETPLASNR